jgi:hypothetical protein
MITFRVILNNVRKSIILTWFFIFDLDENMLNDIIADFFFVGISKKGIKLGFWMFNILKNNFPGTL